MYSDSLVFVVFDRHRDGHTDWPADTATSEGASLERESFPAEREEQALSLDPILALDVFHG
jgi:hypothetical protein